MARWLNELGMNREIKVRIDPEPAMRVVAGQLAGRRRPATTIIEEAPINSPASKGGVESYIALLGGNCMALRLVTEERWKVVITSISPIFPWLVRHASWLHTRFQPLQKGGETAFEKIYKRRYDGQLFQFSEPVLARLPYALDEPKLSQRWDLGNDGILACGLEKWRCRMHT